tara:strand:- start:20 stop:193 length:174 start_codon:yes stop_codon:yes gene_type:complete
MSTKDIIRAAKTQDPATFQSAVEAEISGRVSAALDAKKIDVAQSVFSQTPEEELNDD